MFTKEEKKTFKTDFWTSFGIYMRKHNREFGKVHWVNYKTNIKDLYFRLDFDSKKATFAIDLQHTDEGIRDIFYEQFTELKVVMQDAIGEEMVWEKTTYDEYQKPVSKIYLELENVNLYKKEEWQQVFEFFEKRIVGLHRFWTDFNEIFIQLQS